MEPMECQYHNNCGGWCETNEERDQCLCCDCLEAEREEDAERQRGIEMSKALHRIAVAAGIELAQPGEIADIVCARMISSLAPPNVKLRGWRSQSLSNARLGFG